MGEGEGMGVQTLAEEVVREIEAFDREVERLKSGSIPEEKFKRFRLQNGIYGQRQKGVQMVRVKIPAGTLDSTKLRALADVAETYSIGKGHVTTRQDVQFHFVHLDQITAVMRRLAEAGLTTREACGNTVRNVTACHLAGICPTEMFDVTPYSQAVASHLLRNPINQDLPRKFKISFSGCQGECGLAAIHDIGFIATSRQMDGRTEYGFRVWVAGGLGSSPKLAKPYADFLPVRALLPTCEAILRIFDAHGDRKIKSKARMKFVMERWGLDAFKARVVEQLAWLADSGRSYPTLPEPQPRVPLPVIGNGRPSNGATAHRATSGGGGADGSDHEKWARTNVIPQADASFCAVHVRLIIGDITARQLRGLADIVDRFSPNAIRATHQQNFILHRVRQDDLPALHAALSVYDLARAGAEQAMDVIACPGADTCQLGLTASMGLGEALVNTLTESLPEYEDLAGLRVRISGCPNSCAQHHIAGIGLHGVAKKVNGTLVPHYQFHLGGGVSATQSAIGKARIKIPAKNVPAAVMEIIRVFRAHRQPEESFNVFIARFAWTDLAERLEPFAHLPALEAAPDTYRDYKSEKAFDLEDLGPGECAGTMIDLMETHLRLGAGALDDAALCLRRARPEEAVATLRGGILNVCRALLVPFGIDSPHDDEILKSFQHKVVEQGIVSERFETFTEDLGRWAAPPSPSTVPAYLEAVRAFVRESQEAYDQMDANLKLKKKAQPGEAMTIKSDVFLDLSGVACPMNFVKTKLRLEDMEAGQVLHVILDDGEPMRNVPKSVQNEGHKVLDLSKTPDGRYNLVIEKAD